MIRCGHVLLLTATFLTACSSPTETSWPRAANATYAGILDDAITLVDGLWQGAPYADGGSSRPVVQLLEEPIASGDLDSDGVDELVVILAANFGGSGTYTFIALVDTVGEVSTSVGTAPIGDRITVRSMRIDGNVIVAETVEHADDDPMCCPSLNRTREWALDGDALLETSRDASMRTLRGHATIGHEVRTFVECDSTREGWILDSTEGDLAGVYEALAIEQYQPIFVELDGTWREPPSTGFGAEFEEAIAVDRLIRAEREGFGCLDEPMSYSFRASGNEPGWRLDLRGNDIAISRMSGSATEATVKSLQFESETVVIDADGITIRLTEDRCVDSMSGSIFAWSAVIELGEERLIGCAVEGRMALDEVE